MLAAVGLGEGTATSAEVTTMAIAFHAWAIAAQSKPALEHDRSLKH